MPYIQFDLDAKKLVPHVARAMGASEAVVGWGLVNLWEFCVWVKYSDIITEDQLDACLGIKGSMGPLQAFGFLDGLRVRGCDRYLAATVARRKGGLAAKSNLIPGAFHRLQPKASPTSTPTSAEPPHGLPIGSLAKSLEPIAESLEVESTPMSSATTPVFRPAEQFTLSPEEKKPGFDFMEAWNRLAHVDLPRCKKMTAHRVKAAKLRLKEYGETQFLEAIEKVGTSLFCRGGSSGGWVASPDWLLQPDSIAKVLEGKYDDREKPQDVTRGTVRAESQTNYPPAGTVVKLLSYGH